MAQPKIIPSVYNPDAKFLWVLDNGHGVETPGKESPIWDDNTQLKEYAFNRDMVFRIALKAHAAGLRTYNLVQELYDVRLSQRTARANLIESDVPKILMSIHANAYKKESANGVEVFSTRGETISDPVANHFAEYFFEYLGMTKRFDYSDGDADKEADYAIIKWTNFRAILIEYGFMTNRSDCEKLMDPEWRNCAADITIDAMLKFEEKYG